MALPSSIPIKFHGRCVSDGDTNNSIPSGRHHRFKLSTSNLRTSWDAVSTSLLSRFLPKTINTSCNVLLTISKYVPKDTFITTLGDTVKESRSVRVVTGGDRVLVSLKKKKKESLSDLHVFPFFSQISRKDE